MRKSQLLSSAKVPDQCVPAMRAKLLGSSSIPARCVQDVIADPDEAIVSPYWSENELCRYGPITIQTMDHNGFTSRKIWPDGREEIKRRPL